MISLNTNEYLENHGDPNDEGEGFLTASAICWQNIIKAILEDRSLNEDGITYQKENFRITQGESYIEVCQHDELANWINSKITMKILSWNVGLGSRGQAWPFELVKLILTEQYPYDIIFLQEVPIFDSKFTFDNCGEIEGKAIKDKPIYSAKKIFNRKFWNNYYQFSSAHTFPNGKACEYFMVTLIRKELFGKNYNMAELRTNNSLPSYALAISPATENSTVIINAHLKADTGNQTFASEREKQICGIIKYCGGFDRVIVGGDLNSKCDELQTWIKKEISLPSALEFKDCVKVNTYFHKKEKKQLDHFLVRGFPEINEILDAYPNGVESEPFKSFKDAIAKRVGVHLPIQIQIPLNKSVQQDETSRND